MEIRILTDASAEISKPLQKELNIISLDMPVNYDAAAICDIIKKRRNRFRRTYHTIIRL